MSSSVSSNDLISAAKAGAATPFLEKWCKRTLAPRQVDFLVRVIQDLASPSSGVPVACRNEFQAILRRYGQIQQIPPFARNLLRSSMLRLALFIETKMWGYVARGQFSFNKREHQIARSIIYDPLGAIYILSKSKVPILVDTAVNFKKMRTSLLLPTHYTQQAHFVAHGVNPSDASDEKNQLTFRECGIVNYLQSNGVTLIARLLHSVVLSKQVSETKRVVQKINMFWDFYAKSLEHIVQSYLTVSFDELLAIADDAITSLAQVHALGVIHGDIKPANLLVDEVCGKLRTVLCDFGLAFFQGREKPSMLISSGYYGSIWYTAPELFGVKDFSGDLYKVEIFALGLVLFQIATKTTPQWALFVEKCHKSNTAVTPEQQAELKRDIKQDVDAQLMLACRTRQDQFLQLTRQMMQSEPLRRPELMTAQNFVRNLRRS